MTIYVGIGGWVYEPWRGSFYPKDLPRKRELEYASRHVTAIEINGTYYGSQKPESFARWHDGVPDNFIFTLKGPRFATNRRVLAEAGPSIEKFVQSGITRLKQKLGPINWQFMPSKKYEPEDFAAFLALLPKSHDGIALRHAVEVRHESFVVPDFVALCRRHGVAIVAGADSNFPLIPDVTAGFVYARLMGTVEKEKLGYSKAALAQWAGRTRDWEGGRVPRDLPSVASTPPLRAAHGGGDAVAGRDGNGAPAPLPSTSQRRQRGSMDVFAFFIAGAKERNPAAAQALIAALA
jgi:uncharacterized protein YecE (DUF72 family)